MSKELHLRGRLAFAALLALPFAASADDAAKMTDAQMIESALSAAPAGVARNAKVVAMDGKGGMRTLRDGSNGFTCMPDEPEHARAPTRCASMRPRWNSCTRC